MIDIEPGDTRESHFGIAVDIGTTTVVAMLVDMNQGHVLKKASLYNQQIRLADDVASRISYCRCTENVDELQQLVVQETVNTLIETTVCGAGDLCRVDQSDRRIGQHGDDAPVSGNLARKYRPSAVSTRCQSLRRVPRT